MGYLGLDAATWRDPGINLPSFGDRPPWSPKPPTQRLRSKRKSIMGVRENREFMQEYVEEEEKCQAD